MNLDIENCMDAYCKDTLMQEHAMRVKTCTHRPIIASMQRIHAHRRQMQRQRVQKERSACVGDSLCEEHAKRPFGFRQMPLQTPGNFLLLSCSVNGRGIAGARQRSCRHKACERTCLAESSVRFTCCHAPGLLLQREVSAQTPILGCARCPSERLKKAHASGSPRDTHYSFFDSVFRVSTARSIPTVDEELSREPGESCFCFFGKNNLRNLPFFL